MSDGVPSRLFANRYVWIGIIAVGLLALLSLLWAPSDQRGSVNGSSFNQAPNGYAGWYNSLLEQGVTVEQWQRSPRDLVDHVIGPALPADPDAVQNISQESGTGAVKTARQTKPAYAGYQSAHTLIQVYPRLIESGWMWNKDWVEDWLAAGHQLIVLGVRRPVTEAPFTTEQTSPQGTVTVQTRRRSLRQKQTQLLGDEDGATVWQETQDAGTILFSTTPYLAANAYQTSPGNYDFLSALVAQAGGPVWIDEYLHGYRETETPGTETAEAAEDWFTYLTRTPVLIVTLQMAVMLGVLILAQNQRLGTRSMVRSPQVDNSQAYIQALAGVLQKAGGDRFVADVIAKAERLHLQKTLGFGETAVDGATLGKAWFQRTGRPAQDLDPLLKPPASLASDRSLANWLGQLQRIRRLLDTAERSEG